MINAPIIQILSAMSGVVNADEINQQKVPCMSNDVIHTTYIHNNEYYCTECHLQKPVKGAANPSPMDPDYFN